MYWQLLLTCEKCLPWYWRQCKCSVHVTEFHKTGKVSAIFPLLNVGDILGVCLSVCTHVHAHNLQWTWLVWCKCCYIYLTVNWDGCTVYTKIFIVTMNLFGMVIMFKITSLCPYQLFYVTFLSSYLIFTYIEDFHLCCKFVPTSILCNCLKK
jgi:hypothetical protein